jgi:glycosyltransferase involved in cell wall biosynthesis
MVRILTNFSFSDQAALPDVPLSLSHIGSEGGAREILRFLGKCLRSDLVILNIDQRKLMFAALLRWLPFARFRLISVDLVLRPPRSAKDRLKAFVKRILLSGVDRFALYFKNLEGYQRFYGIGPDRAVYVPFKVNASERIGARPQGVADGEYVLCAGRTLRDIKTFVEAMRATGCPGVLLQQKRELLNAHGTSAWSGELPPNVKLIVDDSDRFEDYLDFIAKARLVVIPRFKNDIAPTGISTYLVAMALNKCVIISEGPGAEDVLTDQAVIVPAEDAVGLAEQIKRLWNDDRLRGDFASRGYEYAISLGGYDRLLAEIINISVGQLSMRKMEKQISTA